MRHRYARNPNQAYSAMGGGSKGWGLVPAGVVRVIFGDDTGLDVPAEAFGEICGGNSCAGRFRHDFAAVGAVVQGAIAEFY